MKAENICESESVLNHMGYSGPCPWKENCKGNLDGGTCELARTVEAFDHSKNKPVKFISLTLEQNPDQEEL